MPLGKRFNQCYLTRFQLIERVDRLVYLPSQGQLKKGKFMYSKRLGWA